MSTRIDKTVGGTWNGLSLPGDAALDDGELQAKACKMAVDGYGYEDIWAAHKVRDPEIRRFVRDIVMRTRSAGIVRLWEDKQP